MKLKIKEIALFAILGSLMFVSKMLTELLPNIHLLGVFTVAFTVVYRWKALFPIYVFVFLTGLVYGFPIWWIPYLYFWAFLWGMAMLIPKNIPTVIQPIVYMLVCSAHGFLYGTLYAPSQALLFGLDFHGMIKWIIAGLPWDAIHGISNLLCGMLIFPIVYVLKQTEKIMKR